ncbi:MAG: MerR family transcriptional regulator [Clostridia bacterium]|nr:MerR family transcriptional regulator [Clostridia bacterium]
MYKIGEFAASNNITFRALQHCEEIGLLKTAETDRYIGYRYCSEEQPLDIRIINLLKEPGFSLSDISDLITNQSSLG